MKNFYFYFSMLFLLVSNYSHSQRMEFEVDYRQNFDFNGVVSNDEIILCYGDFGMIFSSSDMGATWERITLGDSNDIQQMIIYQDAFYGVSDYFLFKSTNNGNSWIYSSLDSKTDEFVVKGLAISNDKIYVPIKDELRVFDTELKELPLEKVKYETQIEGYISLSDNKLAIVTGVNKLKIYDLNTNAETDVTINITNGCNNCDTIRSIQSSNGDFYLKVKNSIVKLNSDFFDYEVILENSPSAYFATNSGIYFINSEVGDLAYFRGSTPVFNTVINFSKLNTNGVLNKINVNQEQLAITNPIFFKSLYRIDDVTLCAVGQEEIITISTDNGLSWEIVSFNPVNGWIYDKNVKLSNRCVLLLSENKVNYKPITKFDPTIQRTFFDGIIALNDDGTGVSFLKQFVQNSGMDSILITKDYGQTYRTVPRGEIRASPTKPRVYPIESGENIIVTYAKFAGNYYCFLHKLSKDGDFLIDKQDFGSSRILNIHKDNSGNYSMLILRYNQKEERDGRPAEPIYRDCYIETMQSSDNGQTWQTTPNEKFYIDHEVYVAAPVVNLINDNVYISFPSEPDFTEPEERLFSVQEVKYNIQLKSYEVLNRYYSEVPAPFFESWNKNLNIYYTEEDRVNSNNYKQFYFTDTFSIVVNSEMIYDLEEIIPRWKHGKRSQINYLGDWQLISINQNNEEVSFTVGVSVDQVFTEKLYRYFPVYLRPKTPSSVENAETETPRSRAFLHAGKPYPLPAVSTVSADLHWNAQYSAQEAVLKVFDSMGNEIPNANVELQQTNPYSGTVTWDCGAYPTGVYFIQVTIGTEQKNVGVAVVR